MSQPKESIASTTYVVDIVGKSTILWTVLTGGSVFGMDVVANLSALVSALGNGGFVALICY